MIAATSPVQRPVDARLLAADVRGRLRHVARREFAELLHAGDLVVANDAATLPASLTGRHVPTGARIEVRLAGARSLDVRDDARFVAIIFGEGDFRMRTEERPAPPRLQRGDRLVLGPATAFVERLLGHERLVELRFSGAGSNTWDAIARHGRPIQYAHVPTPLALWDVWTPIAAAPVAFESPSAGFVLDWRTLSELRARGVGFATLTLATGISSTGDTVLDRRLPLDEPYRIPEETAHAIRRTHDRGGRVVAIGTTVVRALESAAGFGGRVRAGEGIARGRIGPGFGLRLVDAIVTGTHERGTSHYEMLRAFADDATLDVMNAELEARAYRTHEFGDSVLIERAYDSDSTTGRGEQLLRGL